jgi:hypothetical protein
LRVKVLERKTEGHHAHGLVASAEHGSGIPLAAISDRASRRRCRLLIANALVLVAATASVDCRRENTPTPPIVNRPLSLPAGELRYAGTPPAHPFAKQAESLYTRTVFETDAPGHSHVEVRDILIPPTSKSTLAPLPGSAVMDLASGKVALSIGGNSEAMEANAIRSLPAGQTVAIENTDSRPATVRLYIIRAR